MFARQNQGLKMGKGIFCKGTSPGRVTCPKEYGDKDLRRHKQWLEYKIYSFNNKNDNSSIC